MSGLPTKNNQFETQFLYSNGAPKEGTKGFYYLQDALKRAEELGYKKGIKFTIEDITKRLYPLVYMDFEELDKLEPLPNYAVNLNNLILSLKEYAKGLNSQVNNTNPTNFREGTRALIGRAERIMGEIKGTIINELLKGNHTKIVDKRRIKNPESVKITKNKKEPKEIIINPEDKDPSDLLTNEVLEDNTLENTETP